MVSGNNQNYEKRYRVLVVCLGIGFFSNSIWHFSRQPLSIESFVLVGLCLFLSRVTFFSKVDTSSTIVTISESFIYLSFLLNGQHSALFVAGILTFSEALRYAKGKPLVIAFNVAAATNSLFVAGFITSWIAPQLNNYQFNRQTFFSYVTLLVGFALLQGLVHTVFLLLSLMLRPGKPVWLDWLKRFAWFPVTSLSGVLVAALVHAFVFYYGFWAIFSILPLLAAAHAITLPYIRNIKAARQHSEELGNLHQRTLEAFATAVDAKDQITHEHVRRVQIYAEGLAQLLNLSEADIKALRAGALLHDIGKIAVPDFIINKPGKLTAFEFDKMKTHTVVGAQILDQVQLPYPLVPIVRYHHERWDGKGYPEGLKGENIPLTARILSVVDCFDAVREDRQYRKGMTREQAIKLLEDDRGKAFDPQLVDLFIAHLPAFEEKVAQAKQDAHVFKPIEIKETHASHIAQPAAGLIEEKAETPDFVKAIQASRRLSQENYALYEMAEKLAGKLDVQEICSLISSKMDNVIQFNSANDSCVFYWYDENSFSAQVQFAYGAQSDRFQGCTIKPGEGVTGWVLANKELFANTDPALDLYVLSLSKDISQQLEKYTTLAAFPLSKNGEIFGAMVIYSRTLDHFRAEEIDRLKRVSALASETLFSAKLYLEAQKQSFTDSLTGLPNARYLRDCFVQVCKASAQDKFPLTLLLTDLSHFRQVTDKIENRRADQTVKQIAALMQQQIRSYDTLIHFLGDEFIVLLRNTPPDNVIEVVARIQGTIIEHRSSLLSADDAMLGVSIGQARMDSDGDTLEQLLDAAQMRLQADRAARRSLMEEFNS